MEEGTKSKKTIFVGGISDDTDESALYEGFSTFGDILEVQIPPPVSQHRNPAPDGSFLVPLSFPHPDLRTLTVLLGYLPPQQPLSTAGSPLSLSALQATHRTRSTTWI